MRHFLLITAIFLILCAPLASADTAERKSVCYGLLFKMDFLEAYECYKDLGDDLYRDALNALAMGDTAKAASLAQQALPIKTGYGLCYSYDKCGGAAHTATLLAYLDIKAGGTGERWAEKAISLAKKSGQCGGVADEEANSICAIMYYLSALDGFDKGGRTFQQDEVCKRIAGTGDVKNLDILYISHGFGNMSAFKNYVDAGSQTLLGFKPFSNLRGKINIWMLDEPKDLGCRTLEPRMFQCDAAKVAAARVRCPNDQVIIVVKSDDWRGFGFVGGTLSGVSSSKDMPYYVVLHELGHALGLNDEYLYGAGDGVSVSANAPNCDSNSTCPKFAGVAGSGCHRGCQSNDYYRPVDEGMMKTLGPAFGAFDEHYLTQVISRYG